MMEGQFFGHPFSYWLELERLHEADVPDWHHSANLIEEIARLRGKISFYESRVKDMYELSHGT